MTIENIEKFCDEKSKTVVKIITTEYDEVDFETDSMKIEKEIFEICSNYASVFIFENNLLLSDEDKKSILLTLKSRFDVSKRKAEKMTSKDLISHLMKLYVIDYLND